MRSMRLRITQPWVPVTAGWLLLIGDLWITSPGDDLGDAAVIVPAAWLAGMLISMVWSLVDLLQGRRGASAIIAATLSWGSLIALIVFVRVAGS